MSEAAVAHYSSALRGRLPRRRILRAAGDAPRCGRSGMRSARCESGPEEGRPTAT